MLKHVKRILDKRKDWLAEDKEISDKTHEARVIHLKTLFARLEDEQFKLEAEEFETNVRFLCCVPTFVLAAPLSIAIITI